MFFEKVLFKLKWFNCQEKEEKKVVQLLFSFFSNLGTKNSPVFLFILSKTTENCSSTLVW